ncbi:MAG: ribbon-helix-helix protein, CopG family [Actinobacteria bacterium]|nr:ribbon-helix-helix protein, CopG family [Actinomycetota bacterium]
MKVSVSIPDEDLEFIDRYASEHGVDSRSRVVRRAVSLLRAAELGDDYAAAWDEWDESEAEAWEPTLADGLG